MHATSSRRRGRGRRPAGEVEAAALDAAADLLFEEGMPAVTHDRVAARAGVSKTTLYKLWPSTGALAAQAYLHRSEPILELADSGDFATDLTDQMRSFIALVTRPDAGRAVRGIIAAAQTDDSVREAFLTGYIRPRREATRESFLAARMRGEIRADADFDAFIDQLWGACYYRLLVDPDHVSAEYGDTLVRQALRGAGVRRREPSTSDAAPP
jgi:AcrR family transcriptional regulator